MTRRRTTLAVALTIAVAGGGTAAGLVAGHGGKAEARWPAAARQPQKEKKKEKTYAELVAANYKILKPDQTKRLLAYANAAYACLSKQIEIGKPRPSPTKIAMTFSSAAKPRTVARVGLVCALKIGDPPDDSTFQVRGHTVIVYLPKYCILDKKTVAVTKPLPNP